MSVITDDVPTCSIVCFQFKRQDLSDDTFFGYWKQVHGPYIAAAPWTQLYRQVHFNHFRDDLWPDAQTGTSPSFEHRSCGFAHFSFPSHKAYEHWQRDLWSFAEKDHFNMFQTPDDVYRIHRRVCLQKDKQAPQDPDRRINIICLVKTAQDTPETLQFLVSTFCATLASAAPVIHLDLSVFDANPAPNEIEDAASSIHAQAVDSGLGRYAAMLEITLDCDATWRSAVATALSHIRPDIQHYVTAVHAYERRDAIHLVQDGHMTLSGMLGETRAKLATEVGANNIRAMLDDINAERQRIQASLKADAP